MKRRKRITWDVRGDYLSGHCWRRVAGFGWELAAYNLKDAAPCVSTHHVRGWPESVDLSHLDTAPHTAFVRGSLPPAVYADWLEENSVQVPAQVLELLRS